MTTVTPQTLSSIDSNSSWHVFSYRWTSTDGVYEIYSQFSSSGTQNPSDYDIKVDTTTNTWLDHGISHPNNPLSESGGVITLSSPSDSNLYKFTKPTEASWISTGGGGGGVAASGVKKVFCNFW